ncbi:MAG TPA: hypothetical protein VFY54_10500, partial [Rubrobacter sp.]|nr:hypothetical protein [Rubrobacter sp.]
MRMRSGVIMASGSEVQLAVQARDLLQAPRSKMSIWTRRKLSSGVSGWPRHAPPNWPRRLFGRSAPATWCPVASRS